LTEFLQKEEPDLLTPGIPTTGWVEDALCNPHNPHAPKDAYPDLWFGGAEGAHGKVRTQNLNQAKAICAECPVRASCLQLALAAPKIMYGIWAGTTEVDRRPMRAALRRVRRELDSIDDEEAA
jgi:WhiB family redox-sensing transcriptional regulator